MKTAVDRLCDLFADKTELCSWRSTRGEVRHNGGRQRLAEHMGIDASLLSRWNATGKRGGHGSIPPQYNQIIVEACDKAGIPRGLLVGILSDTCPACGSKIAEGQFVQVRR